MAIHVGGNGPTYIFSWKCVVVIKKKKKKNDDSASVTDQAWARAWDRSMERSNFGTNK